MGARLEDPWQAGSRLTESRPGDRTERLDENRERLRRRARLLREIAAAKRTRAALAGQPYEIDIRSALRGAPRRAF